MHSVLQSPLFHDIVTINLEEQHSLLLELKITKGLICIDQEKEYVESVGLSKIIK